MDLTLGLNDKQKEAVLTTEGPVMVIAGAGSGKTKVLTHRIAHIINNLGVEPQSILAVTFTNKASVEMKERVSKLLNMDTKYMWISTFHSFCSRVLRKEIHHLGYRTNFNIIDTDDALKELKIVIKTNNYTDYEPKELQHFISNYKNGVSVGIHERYISNFHIIYDLYEKHLFDNNLLDFDDLIIKTLTIFKTNTSVLEKYSSMFNYIMIDEFQDTNGTQYELVLLLASYYNNVFIVGDQDQSIYSFRGALVTNINQFRHDYSKSKLILLEENYRSSQSILDAANRVIESNSNRIKKNLFTSNGKGEEPIIKQLDSSYGEANYISREIKYLLKEGYQYKDIAIIYRLNSLSRGYEDEFIKQNIPYVIYGGLSYFSRKEVKDIIAYLRLICDTNDNFSLRRIINVPRRGVGDVSMKIIEEYSTVTNSSMFDVLDTVNVSAKVANELSALRKVVLELRDRIEKVNLNDFVKEVVSATKYEKMLIDADEEDRLDNIKELQSVLLDVSEHYEGTNKEKLEAFLLDLALKTDTDNVKEDDNKVKLMSYHQAKGLEFKVVFMTAMEQDIFPASRSVTQTEKEEEYRICYVGVTRAKEKLYLLHTEFRRLYGKDSRMFPSIFLDKIRLPKDKKIATSVVYNKSNYSIGDKVLHKAWGVGVVVVVNGDTLQIAFDVSIGLKTLKAGHPSFSKLEE